MNKVDEILGKPLQICIYLHRRIVAVFIVFVRLYLISNNCIMGSCIVIITVRIIWDAVLWNKRRGHMKKLVLFILFAVAAPLIAITEAQYQEQIAQFKNDRIQRLLKIGRGAFTQDHARAAIEDEFNPQLQNVNKALLLFAMNGQLPAVQYLIESKGANPNYLEAQQTPLSKAAKEGKADVVKYLLDQGADRNIILRTQGVNPQRAIDSARLHQEIVEILETYRK
jgi:hypothetical protein